MPLSKPNYTCLFFERLHTAVDGRQSWIGIYDETFNLNVQPKALWIGVTMTALAIDHPESIDLLVKAPNSEPEHILIQLPKNAVSTNGFERVMFRIPQRIDITSVVDAGNLEIWVSDGVLNDRIGRLELIHGNNSELPGPSND